jgi:4-hydroxymandelate oxidase
MSYHWFMDYLNLLELEELARAKLPRMAFDYYAGGSHDEITLRENVAAFGRLRVHYRVLRDVSARSTKTRVLGQEVSFPVLVATTSIEDVAQGTTGPLWFQLYVYKDRGATEAVVARAEAAGCRALVVTVDAPLLGTRERCVRNEFALPPGLAMQNMAAAGYAVMPTATGDSSLAAYVRARLDPSLSWKDLAWLRSRTKLPILVKGIVRADDARLAVDAGVAGIVVSNHGGRQLDSSPATIDVLPYVVDAVAERCEVLMDGGVRRGTDVLKALALGAKAVLLGRPVLWGLTLGGQQGVERVLDTLRRELDLAMALAGCASVGEVTRDLLEPI